MTGHTGAIVPSGTRIRVVDIEIGGRQRSGVALRSDGRTLEFIKDQYRHCKPILAAGASRALLDACGIEITAPHGQPDPGLIITTDTKAVLDDFVTAIARHRHYARETDPPRYRRFSEDPKRDR